MQLASQLSVKVRLLVVRHPVVYWCAIVALAGVIALSAAASVRRVDREREAWGSSTDVWVAVADAQIGDVLIAERRHYPTAMVPPTAAHSLPVGAIALHDVAAGEIVVAADVTDAGVAGLVVPGQVALAVQVAGGPHLAVGAPVSAFAEGVHLADGTIVALGEREVVVAVDATDAATLALAIINGSVVIGATAPP